jgi:hypothetical protein
MLDTIVITMNEAQFQILDYERFSPSAVGLFKPPFYRLGARGNFSCYQNPLKNSGYKPRLTLTKRMKQGGFTVALRIEFSAPKLILGNNFDELTDTDFDNVIQTLIEKMKEMGVETDYEQLVDAEISAIHYSKNIPLIDYSTCSMIIGELHKIDLNRRLDLAGTDYRNNGQAIRYHANSFEITFYDKIKDLQQAKTSEKRAIEKDNAMQIDLFAGREFQKQFDVLRMEVRLGNRRKIKQILEKLAIEPKLTFSRLFDSCIAQKVLQHYWHEIWKDLKIPLMASEDTVDIYNQVAASGNYKPAKILQLVGAIVIIQSIGVRGLRNLMESSATNRTWQRLKKEIDGLHFTNQKKFSAIANIGQHIEEFEPLKLVDYEI